VNGEFFRKLSRALWCYRCSKWADKKKPHGFSREKGTKTSPGDSEPEPDTEQLTFFGKQSIHHQPGGRVITHTTRGG